MTPGKAGGSRNAGGAPGPAALVLSARMAGAGSDGAATFPAREGSDDRTREWRSVRAEYLALVREGLLHASSAAASGATAQGIPTVEASGQLIRPLIALSAVSDPRNPPAGFWNGVLAIQLAHEASLVHDDIVDGAEERRGVATDFAKGGVPLALLRGDHLLTAAYRAAASTGNLQFVTLFARAVERTVAGEAVQSRVRGQRLDFAAYEAIARGKAGELLGCALALAPVLEGRRDAAEMFELGRGIGLLYQMLDDLLDYCPSMERGKPALGDHAMRRWTWVLEECPELGFDRPRDAVLELLHGGPDPRTTPMGRCVARLAAAGASLLQGAGGRVPHRALLGSLVEEWVEAGRQATADEARAQARRRHATALRRRLPALSAADGFLATHSRSFRFATRFFPAEEAARVARVYAFCRVTDDLVDRPPEGVHPEQLLDSWIDLAGAAYGGGASGLPLLDGVMQEMAAARVPFAYVEALGEGMRMDLRGERYATGAELRRYTYRVASVVGLWVTRLFGVNDDAILLRAERLGHAMQLTNILRDVGEDWARGRLYLPADAMLKHGVAERQIEEMWRGGAITPGYRRLVEDLTRVAEEDYASAIEAVPLLPRSLGRSVMVAAYVYRGIHRALRRNGYDNLRRRAYTSPAAKGVLAAHALFDLRRASTVAAPHPIAAPAAAGLPTGRRE